MPTYRFPVRVYYEDTDFSGAVYHANYLRFMERARTELLRSLGVEQGGAISAGPGTAFGLVVRSVNVEYLKPARMDDMLVIETTPAVLLAASFELDQRVLRGDELIVVSRVRIACVIDGRAARLPAYVRAALVSGGA